MSVVKHSAEGVLSEESYSLVTELERLLRDDSSDESTAAFVLKLVAEDRITAEVARVIYGEAISRVYFGDGK